MKKEVRNDHENHEWISAALLRVVISSDRVSALVE
jgi:hypothetical protein